MRWIGAAFAALLVLPPAEAGTELPVRLQGDAKAKITVASCFDQLPSAGYAPIDLKIENSSPDAHTWSFVFTGSSGYGGSVTSHGQVTVGPRSARTFRLTVPLALTRDPYAPPLSIQVSGYGADPASTAHFPAVNRHGKPLTPFVGLSETLATRFAAPLEEAIKNGSPGRQFAKVRFAAAELPEDWRALTGLTAVWITALELVEISPAQRSALRDWVYRGGKLFISGDSVPAEFAETGFGKVSAVPLDLDIDATAAAIDDTDATLAAQLTTSYTTTTAWEARSALGALDINVPLLVGFMVVFAVISGPVNLFWFAPAGRRHRLFWTTPVTSLVAGLVLALLIVLHDGFGGSGHRFAVVYVNAASRQQVVLQEQIARTGVLRSSEFTTADPTFIAPITLEPARMWSGESTQNVDRRFTGLFRNRALQAQWLESIGSTRGEIALLNNGAGTEPTAPPVIVSSINGLLEELVYVDATGVLWHGTGVRAGERITLTRLANDPLLVNNEAGPRLLRIWKDIWRRPGHFYATSNDPGALIATLPSIRWERQRVVYFGPVSAGAPQL